LDNDQGAANYANMLVDNSAPTRSADDPEALPRFADSIARILAVTGRG
jgi:hypothetical protein